MNGTVMNGQIMGVQRNITDSPDVNPTPALAVMYSVMVVVSAVGNSLLILAIVTQPKLRRPCNVYIAGMAVTDLVFMICHIVAIHSSVVGAWVFSDTLCCLTVVVIETTAIFSLAHLVTIALHRYLYVCKHFQAERLFTWKATWLIEFATCVVGASVVAPSWYLSEPGYDTRINMCIFASQEEGQWKYPLYLLINLIVFPCSVSIWCYYQIYMHVKKIKKKLLQNQTISSERKSQMIRNQLQQLGSRFLVFLAFLVTFLPFLLIKILDSLVYIPDEVHLVFVVLLSTNTMINPIIYGVLNTNFRNGYTMILPRLWQCMRRKNKVHGAQGQMNTNRPTTNAEDTKEGDLDDSVINYGTLGDE